ncbi:MAG: leucine-rich repeat protein [Bacteroidota bacterium]|nr:leucine-rich repeat protein [Bacteroidota bacterium]
MKTRRIVFLIVFTLLKGLDLQAQDVAVTLHVATAGTLSTLIDSNQKNQITKLTLTGNLNGDDIRYIREMAGCDVHGQPIPGKLSVLELSGANIVSGGGYYFYYNVYSRSYYTAADTISQLMFFGCPGLTSIALPNSVTAIVGSAFYNCTGLTSIAISSSAISIGSLAFQGCSGLTSITIPSSVTSIENLAFDHCTRLTELNVDSSNSQYSSFDGVLFNKDRTSLILCPEGKSSLYTIPSSVTSIGQGAFMGCGGLTSITIPSSVNSIESLAFCGCTRLTSIALPSSVTSIMPYTFWASGLTSITIPKNVTSIGGNAFYCCSRLTEIHCQALIPPIADVSTFLSVYTTCILFVPKGTFKKYYLTKYWGNFYNIMEEDGTPVNEIRTNNISVFTEQNEIIVKGANVGETIFVYTINGTLLKTIKATNEVRINVPSNQLYLVKTAGKAFKVSL